MTDFPYRLAARALGAAAVAQPIVATIFAPARGLSPVDAPTEPAATDRAVPRALTDLAPSPDERHATVPPLNGQSASQDSRRGRSPDSESSAPVFRNDARGKAAGDPARVDGGLDARLVAPVEPRSDGIVAPRGAEPMLSPPSASIPAPDRTRAQPATVLEVDRPAAATPLAIPLATRRVPAAAIPAVNINAPGAPSAPRGPGARSESQPRVVRVTIGRIEVRAQFSSPASHDAPARKDRPSTLSLDEYQRQRAEGQR